MSTSPLNLLKLSPLLLTLAACGSSGGGGGSSGSGGSATTGRGTADPYSGYVLFGLNGASSYAGEAGFYTTFSNNACSGGTVQGTCCYQTVAAAEAYGKTVPSANVSAGAVTLRDGTRNLASLPFDGGYVSVNSITTAAITWSPGDTLAVSASGDASGVASFAGTVVAPAPLTGLNPDLTTAASISRTSDFTLGWTAASAGAVSLLLSDTSGDTIRCTATGSSGAMTVPAALLTNFQSGDTVGIGLTVLNNSTASATNASVNITAEIIAHGTATVL